jgi:transcriptional regulator with XRE-family HTH domain
MTGTQLLTARDQRGWTQHQASAALRVSQPYLSLMEKGRRRVPNEVARRAASVFKLSAEALPLEKDSGVENHFPSALGALGYPGYGFLKGKKQNPAALLLQMLSQNDMERRTVEALPWLVANYSNMEWEWLVREAKVNDLQNRLGYVTELAAAMKSTDRLVREHLTLQREKLERARLAREDTLSHESMTRVERAWLREHRPPEARHWNLLTDLQLAHLPYE